MIKTAHVYMLYQQFEHPMLLDEIAAEFHDLAGRYAEAEADAAPVIAAVETIY